MTSAGINIFNERDRRLLAAAYCSLKGANDVDWDKMCKATGMTKGSVQNAFPTVKRRAMALGENGCVASDDLNVATPKKAKATGAKGKKKGLSANTVNGDEEDDEEAIDVKPAPKGRKRKAKTEEPEEYDGNMPSEEEKPVKKGRGRGSSKNIKEEVETDGEEIDHNGLETVEEV